MCVPKTQTNLVLHIIISDPLSFPRCFSCTANDHEGMYVALLWVLPTPHVIFAISPNWENCLKTHLLSRRGFVIPSFLRIGVEMQKLSKVKVKIYFPLK